MPKITLLRLVSASLLILALISNQLFACARDAQKFEISKSSPSAKAVVNSDKKFDLRFDPLPQSKMSDYGSSKDFSLTVGSCKMDIKAQTLGSDVSFGTKDNTPAGSKHLLGIYNPEKIEISDKEIKFDTRGPFCTKDVTFEPNPDDKSKFLVEVKLDGDIPDSLVLKSDALLFSPDESGGSKDGKKFPWWGYLIIAVGGVLALILVIVITVIIIVCRRCKKQRVTLTQDTQTVSFGNEEELKPTSSSALIDSKGLLQVVPSKVIANDAKDESAKPSKVNVKDAKDKPAEPSKNSVKVTKKKSKGGESVKGSIKDPAGGSSKKQPSRGTAPKLSQNTMLPVGGSLQKQPGRRIARTPEPKKQVADNENMFFKGTSFTEAGKPKVTPLPAPRPGKKYFTTSTEDQISKEIVPKAKPLPARPGRKYFTTSTEDQISKEIVPKSKQGGIDEDAPTPRFPNVMPAIIDHRVMFEFEDYDAEDWPGNVQEEYLTKDEIERRQKARERSELNRDARLKKHRKRTTKDQAEGNARVKELCQRSNVWWERYRTEQGAQAASKKNEEPPIKTMPTQDQ